MRLSDGHAPVIYVCLIQINNHTGGKGGIRTPVGQSVFVNVLKNFPHKISRSLLLYLTQDEPYHPVKLQGRPEGMKQGKPTTYCQRVSFHFILQQTLHWDSILLMHNCSKNPLKQGCGTQNI